MTYTVFCTACGRHHPDSGRYQYGCPDCGAIMDVAYDLESLRQEWSQGELAGRPRGIGRWRELLPLAPEEELVTMGEGETPLVEAPAAALGCEGVQLLLKLETCNPSGSFKDRAIAVAVSKARASGVEAAVMSSTGNAGISLASYGAFLGLPCYVLVPHSTPGAAILRMTALGAIVIRVEGDVSAPFRLAREAAAHFGWADLATTFLSPYPTEGNKTAGYEIAMQLRWRPPDWVLVPVGDGPLLYACHKSFAELQALGLVAGVPHLAAIQAAGCAPIYRAWQRGEPEVRCWDSPKTIARGIADPLRGYPQDGTFALRAIRASEGTAVAVADEEILAARDDLLRRAGVMAEPTGAVALAGLRRMLANGQVTPGQSVVLIVTGRGIDEPSRPPEDWPIVRPDLNSLVEAVTQIRTQQKVHTHDTGG